MGKSKIEWCDKSWNPITGCSPVSEGCRSCYAQRMANRLRGRYGYPKDDPFKVTFHPDRLDEPLHWKKPCRIFVCSMGDIAHREVRVAWFDATMDEIYANSNHIFLMLTKRPDRLKSLLSTWLSFKNLWLGVSVEDQKTADERIPILLEIPAAHYFVSVEPMLGPVKFNRVDLSYRAIRGISWVICGGLSLPAGKIQPPKREWVDNLIQQCDAAGVSIFIKPNAKYPVKRKDFPYGSI